MTREPVAWIGVAVAVAIGVIQTLTGQGVLSDAIAGRATDIVNIAGQAATWLVPIILGILATRRVVTPVADPALPQGTTVTVVTPGDAPNTKTTL